MRRHLSWIFAGTLLLGGLAACSDDDDDSGDVDTEQTTTTAADDSDTERTEADDSGDSGDVDADVQAYCDDVQAFVDAVNDAGTDPAALAGLTDESQALQESGTALASRATELDEDDAETLANCTQEATDALQDLIPG